MRKPLFLALLAVVTMAASGLKGNLETPVTELAGWRQAGLPSDKDLQCANYSRDEWQVTLESGSLRIKRVEDEKDPSVLLPVGLKRTKGMAGRVHSLRLGEKWLVGFDAGEFGGGLWLYDEESSSQRQLLQENVQDIIKTTDGVLIFTGLSHLGSDYGRVYSASQAGDDLRLRTSLGGSPSASFMDADGSILTVTTQGVLRVHKDGTYEQIYKKEIGELYPNSIVRDFTGSIFVGMRFYVLKLETAQVARWYVPEHCSTIKLRDLDCVCTGSKKRKG